MKYERWELAHLEQGGRVAYGLHRENEYPEQAPYHSDTRYAVIRNRAISASLNLNNPRI